MTDKPAKTWGGISRQSRKGGIGNIFSEWIHKNIKKHGMQFTFRLKEIMDANGLNYYDKDDNARASRYFLTQRKGIERVLELFWGSNEYQQAKSKGMNEDEIFEKLVIRAIQENIYPMWADPYDKFKYKLFDLESYLLLMNRRARSLITEVENRSRVFSKLKEGIPQIEQRYKRPELTADGEILKLPGSKDDKEK